MGQNSIWCNPQIALIGVVSFRGDLQKLPCSLNTLSTFQYWKISARNKTQFFVLNIGPIRSKLCITKVRKSVCAPDLNILLPIFCTLRKELREIYMQKGRYKNLWVPSPLHGTLSLRSLCKYGEFFFFMPKPNRLVNLSLKVHIPQTSITVAMCFFSIQSMGKTEWMHPDVSLTGTTASTESQSWTRRLAGKLWTGFVSVSRAAFNSCSKTVF